MLDDVINQKKRSIAEINVVPYVDVTLVLLVIFMVTAPLVTQGVKVELPQARTEILPPSETLPVVVSVDKNGLYYINISEKPGVPVDGKIIQAKVMAALKINPKRPVLVRGDKKVNYNKVLQAMVILQKAGAVSVGLQTEG